MSVIPKIRVIIKKAVPVVSNLANISNIARGTISGSSRAYSKDIKIEITNAQQEDAPIELEKNPFEKKKEKCILCKYNIEPDYKNVRLLSQFQSRYTGRIYGSNITGLCQLKQNKVENEIRKAQACGFMPFMTKIIEYVHDPKLFDPEHPFRPHKY
ncbi:28S ribosomal protein S18c, mitochondrial [Belonocnema kinseyi]|uniref:28S ribosomal protein S18c, mitochondrial n=1 Tax=Belonocnema kinseyi TaxID=2817044 RepID=UPI00143DC373|nr:28S ribosomal protein S18c, mitochondrial [Belonocnema kinseyi]